MSNISLELESEISVGVAVSVLNRSKTDGRKIIKNMEEVLNSVKRNHKNKHKHRHHHRKWGQNSQKLPIANKLDNLHESDQKNVEQYSPSKENILANNSKNINNEDVGPKKFQSTSKKILTTFSSVNKVSLKYELDVLEVQTDIDENIPLETIEIIGQQQTKKNAFEFMMNARSKSIGTNSPGKAEIEIDNAEPENLNKHKSKRKLFLEEWADQKGAKKRKRNEEVRKEYVEDKLTKRAKRLKKMIVNGNQNVKIVSPKKQNKNKVLNSNKTNKTSIQRQTDKTSEQKRSPSSVESDKTVTQIPIEVNDFVSKLSSPIKKRDSLLGYFAKTISPNADIKIENELEIKSIYNESKMEKIDSNLCSLKSRPRRSCVGKNRYDYDLDESPTKTVNTQVDPKTKGTEKLKVSKLIQKNKDSDIICIEDNENCIKNKQKKSKKEELTKKLAPVFLKTVPKPNIDPNILKARHDFLMSGVPEKMKQDIAKQKQFEEKFDAAIEIFPKICHAPHWEIVYAKNIKWENCGIIWIKEDFLDELSIPFSKNKNPSSKFKSKFNFINLNSFNNQNNKLMSLTSLPLLKNKLNLIKDWKKMFDSFPTYKCYNQLREKYRHFTAMDTALHTQQITESFIVTKLTRSKQKSCKNVNVDERPPDSAPNGELLFTEKYKPMSSEQILVNVTPVNNLKDFLSSWQCDKRNQRLNDSMADFDCSNDSNSSNCSNTVNTIVLLGPNSSGKTQAVFALADELNFNVLEINAGMKRTGKKLLQELQEATQSHQIRKHSKDKLLKASLNAIKSKKSDINIDNFSCNELSTNEKMSLILVEDADVTFDQYDAGYIDAVYQLASTSKRPVVMIANNRYCPYLLRFISLNSIEFSAPNTLNISKFLTILSLIENCPIDLDEIISLYLFNNMDLRRTILEMQFFIQSGGDRMKSELIEYESKKLFASPTKRRLSLESCKVNDESVLKDDKNNEADSIYMHSTLFELFTRSQNVNTLIPFPVNLNLLWTNLNSIFHISKSLLMNKKITPKQKKSKSPQTKSIVKNNVINEVQVLNTLAEFYENISVSSCLSLKENVDKLTLNLEEEITHTIIEESVKNILKVQQCSYNLFSENQKKRINLTPSTANVLNKSKSKFLDYESSLRSICRSEKNRLSLERRSTRFYHYLRNNQLRTETCSTNIYDEACYILTDTT